MIRVSSASIFVWAIYLLIARSASADIQFVDQQNLNQEALIADPSSRFSQSFTPSVSVLNAIEVVLFVTGAQSVSVELTLFKGQGLSYSVERSTGYITVPAASGPIPVEFRFPSPISVQPGAVYTFSIGSALLTPFSAQYGSDTYSGGNMFDSHYIYPDRDLYFREGLSVPPPTIRRTSDRQIQLRGAALPNHSVTIWTTSNLVTENFIYLGTATTDSVGAWQYNDCPPPGAMSRFYRITAP